MSDREIMDGKNGVVERESYGFRDPVVKNVVNKFVDRSNLGYEKYGQTLDEERTSRIKGLAEYLNDIQEELMDNIGRAWETDFGSVMITKESAKWIINNAKPSQYTSERCYVYNKAFARWFDNHELVRYSKDNCNTICDDCGNDLFNCIRAWANERGLYDKGDPKTQYIKLMEETGEIGRAILKNDTEQIIDGIGVAVVVLTNLAELVGVPIEECIQEAYNVISKRKGKMINGTFVKDEQ